MVYRPLVSLEEADSCQTYYVYNSLKKIMPSAHDLIDRSESIAPIDFSDMAS